MTAPFSSTSAASPPLPAAEDLRHALVRALAEDGAAAREALADRLVGAIGELTDVIEAMGASMTTAVERLTREVERNNTQRRLSATVG